jgi:hypothetical protein
LRRSTLNSKASPLALRRSRSADWSAKRPGSTAAAAESQLESPDEQDFSADTVACLGQARRPASHFCSTWGEREACKLRSIF